MTRRKGTQVKNLAASVRARLLSRARAEGEDFNYLLTRYVLERVLYRLSVSPHRSSFLLKGAMLFTLWSQRPHRATKDIDLLGYGAPNLDRLSSVFRDVCEQPIDHDDGVVFLSHTVRAEAIREDAVYDGIRIRFVGKLGSAQIPVQVDVGFGDVTAVAASTLDLPTLLEFPAPRLSCYSREVVIAEKLHAMTDLGMANSRMKDFFDVWFLAQQFEFDGGDLMKCIVATFERRRTSVPVERPLALTEVFSQEPTKLQQWQAFLKRTRADASPSLAEVVRAIADFAQPIFAASLQRAELAATWPPGGPWRSH